MRFNGQGRSAQYEEFFMKPNAGKKHTRLGSTSVIDEVIMGRDMDFSGTDPHKEFMSKYGNHAGLKSGEKYEKGKRPGYSMASTMDTVIWGRDFDKSGADPQQNFLGKHRDHAGSLTVDKDWRPCKKQGYAMASVMDTVIWGRDFDQSGDDPSQSFGKIYNGHAGGASGHAIERPLRKIIHGNSASMDEILTGVDMDGSEDAHAAFMAAHESHAGVRSVQKPDRPFRKPTMAMKSTIDNVIWGRDLDQSGNDFQEDLYEGAFAGAAGANPGMLPKSARRAAAREKLGSKSMPDLKEAEVQRRPSSGFEYKPQARRPSIGSVSGAGSGSGSGSVTARSPAQAKSSSDLGSVGSLTSRDYGQKDCWASPGTASPTEKTLNFADPGSPSSKPRGVRSQCSTASSSAGSKPRWR